MVFRNKKSVSRQVQKNKYDSETKLRSYALLSEEELLDHFATGKTGLTSQEAEERLDEYGENTITAGQGNTIQKQSCGPWLSFHRRSCWTISPREKPV